MLSHAGAILNRSPLAILLSRSAQDISEGSFFSFKISSIYFEVVISFKSFNSTGAISLFQIIAQWCFFWVGPNPQVFSQDLTWLFLFPRISSNFLSKFDVRMNYHQSNAFHQDLSNSFHRWFNLFILILPECLNKFMVVFLIIILCIWRPKKSFTSISYPFSQRFVVLVQGHPLIIVLIMKILFLPPEPIISEDLFILSLQLSFSKSYRCFVQAIFNQFVILSFSWI